MTFKFPNFGISKEFTAIHSNDYSLRDIATQSNQNLKYNKKFQLLAYILPYQRPDGSKSWCDVGTNGKDIAQWYSKFNLNHYLIFEIIFE